MRRSTPIPAPKETSIRTTTMAAFVTFKKFRLIQSQATLVKRLSQGVGRFLVLARGLVASPALRQMIVNVSLAIETAVSSAYRARPEKAESQIS